MGIGVDPDAAAFADGDVSLEMRKEATTGERSSE